MARKQRFYVPDLDPVRQAEKAQMQAKGCRFEAYVAEDKKAERLRVLDQLSDGGAIQAEPRKRRASMLGLTPEEQQAKDKSKKEFWDRHDKCMESLTTPGTEIEGNSDMLSIFADPVNVEEGQSAWDPTGYYVVLRVDSVYPTKEPTPAFSASRYGLKAFLSHEDFVAASKMIAEGVTPRVCKVRVVRKSASGKSVTVKVLAWGKSGAIAAGGLAGDAAAAVAARLYDGPMCVFTGMEPAVKS